MVDRIDEVQEPIRQSSYKLIRDIIFYILACYELGKFIAELKNMDFSIWGFVLAWIFFIKLSYDWKDYSKFVSKKIESRVWSSKDFWICWGMALIYFLIGVVGFWSAGKEFEVKGFMEECIFQDGFGVKDYDDLITRVRNGETFTMNFYVNGERKIICEKKQ